jgi:Domain of unknown function (DUF4292)
MVPRRPILLVTAALLVLSGCPRRGVDFGKDGAPTSAEQLLERINFAEAQVFALKGDARLGVESPQGKGSITLFVAVAHPALVHIEQLDFFGRPQSVLVTNGTDFGLYMSQEGKYYRGPATAANLGRFLPLVMPPTELVAVMLGRAPRIPQQRLEMGFDETQHQLVLTLERQDVKQTLHVSPPSYRVVKSEVEHLAAYELTFPELRIQGQVTFAKSLVLEAASQKTRLELTWKDVALNEAPDLTLFELEPPEGASVVEVDGTGAPRAKAISP